MTKDEAWKEVESSLRTVCSDRCVEFNCGCDKLIQQIKEVLYV